MEEDIVHGAPSAMSDVGGFAPRARRPQFRGYGVSEELDGMLPWSWAEERLIAGHNYWLATASTDHGPHASPIWGVWRDGTFAFSCGRESRKARDIAADPRVVFHLESGDDVVTVEGVASPIASTPELVDAYVEKYGPVDPAVGEWYVVQPRRAFAWQEATMTRTASRFDF
jgi:hypothetical protein